MTSLLRRSELAVPAANDHMFVKAAASEADLVFLDLEDATAEVGEHHPSARGTEVDGGELPRGRAAHRRNAAATPASTGTCSPVVCEKSSVQMA